MAREYNKKQNVVNLFRYRTTNGGHQNAVIYKCVLCGAEVSLSSSMSNRGKKLTCNECIKSEFGTFIEAFDWMMFS